MTLYIYPYHCRHGFIARNALEHQFVCEGLQAISQELFYMDLEEALVGNVYSQEYRKEYIHKGYKLIRAKLQELRKKEVLR